MWCTGTLIACDKVLTAAHCLEDEPNHIDDNPGHYQLFFQELRILRRQGHRLAEGTVQVSLFRPSGPDVGETGGGHRAYASQPGEQTARQQRRHHRRFRRTGGSRLDYGIKREGSVRTEACRGAYATVPLMCWKFDAEATWRARPRTPATAILAAASSCATRTATRHSRKESWCCLGWTRQRLHEKGPELQRRRLALPELDREGGWRAALLRSNVRNAAICLERREDTERNDRPRVERKRRSPFLPVPAGVQELRVSMNAEDSGTSSMGALTNRGNMDLGSMKR